MIVRRRHASPDIGGATLCDPTDGSADDDPTARCRCRRAAPASGGRRHRGGVGPRRRPGPGRGLRARRGHAHARVRRPRPRALAAAGLEADRRRRLWWGTSPPAVRRGPEPRGPRRRARPAPPRRRRADRGLAARGHGGAAARAADAVARRLGAASRSWSRPTRCGPGSGTGFEARCGAGAAAVVLAADGRRRAALGARVTRTRPFLDRYRGDGETDDRDLYDARLFREEMFLPVVARGRRARSPSFDVARVVAPRPRRPARRDRRASTSAAARPRRPRSTPRSATPARPRALLGAIGALDARRDRRDRRHRRRPHDRRRRSTSTTPVPGAARVADAARPTGGRRRTPRCCAPAASSSPTGETIPMGVPPESAMFVRGADEMLGLLGGRCVDCGTISTPPSIHPHCIACGGTEARAGAARPARASCTPSSSTRRCRRRSSRRCRSRCSTSTTAPALMLQVVGDGTDVEIGADGRARAAPVRARAGRPRLRLQGAAAASRDATDGGRR